MAESLDTLQANLTIFDADKIANDFLEDLYIFDPEPDSDFPVRNEICYTLASWRDEFYYYKEWYWRRMSDADMKLRITRYIQTKNCDDIGAKQINITVQKVNNVILCLKARCAIPETVESNSWKDGREKIIYTLPCKNGLVCWDKKDLQIKPILQKHTPLYFNFFCLSYDYDPEKTCPDWLNFLDDIMLKKAEYIDVLQRWTGYLFRPDLREQKFLLCYGEGSNGKGVFFEVIQNLVGKENCSQIGLKHFEDKFALYGTLGKLVNITAESSHIIADEAENVLKSYVAGDTFTFERKFKDPVSAVPTAKIMISTNALPRFRDKSQAVWRRMLLIPFDNIIPPERQLKNLAAILQEESTGILNWAIEGLRKLNKDGFVIPESHSELIENYRRDADPCRAFLLENYMAADDSEYMDSPDLYRHYVQWTNESGFEPVNNRLFGQQVKRAFSNVTHKRIRIGSDRVYRFFGLQKSAGTNDESE